ncbi:MAG: hydroxyisourate hydrolase [Gammaproteobacteria bacterium]|nr:hydroxyisourate hydrolase [Gammaproteobacteria bacterium]MDD9798919.1 hydroxyisourate hydrolase [Gammaproteobacteria bacterium]MDD9815674.1 hydroxyisourate hydrolase [Gammaproteobacteria bacterium]MDD9851598.1 hydroxyisourate hydrolase [Gammaproteobacteria bacterium]MDD9871580.1 hydroxyisourate hydrolase [Gammaproteobacteria bacterium]
MALVTSHVLDCVNGGHAGGVAVEIYRVAAGGERCLALETVTDGHGRLSEQLQAGAGRYEMVLKVGEYFTAHGAAADGRRMVSEIVFRFAVTDADQHCHIPVMLSPHSYAVWWSGW